MAYAFALFAFSILMPSAAWDMPIIERGGFI